jgi:hypothetical protein
MTGGGPNERTVTRARILQRLITPKRDKKVQASRSGFCHKRRDKGNIKLLGLSVITAVAIKPPDTICGQPQRRAQRCPSFERNVQNKLILAQPVLRLTRIRFCSAAFFWRAELQSLSRNLLKAVQIDLVFRRRPLGAVMGSLVVCTWARPL